jgi:3-hydroxyacyl-CoA dehydrogenase
MIEIDNVKKVAVIGAGVMGSGIALASLLAGYEKVTVNDLNDDILEKSRISIGKILDEWGPIKDVKKGLAQHPALLNVKLEELFEDTDNLGILGDGVNKKEIITRLRCESDLSEAVKDADYIVEVVTEKLDIKQEIFKKLGKYAPSHAILATNTSTISITKIGAFSGRSNKVVGMHFHNYFPLNARLIEVTPGEETSEATIDICYSFATKLPCAFKDKFVVQLEKESPGLIANRLSLVSSLFMDYYNDQIFEKGISNEVLIAMGIISPAEDVIGIDVIYGCMKYFEENVSREFSPGKRLAKLYNEGRFGKKVGKGYYDWDENGPIIKEVTVDDETKQFLGSLMGSIDWEIIGAISLNECCRLLEEGVMKSYNLLDKTIKA